MINGYPGRRLSTETGTSPIMEALKASLMLELHQQDGPPSYRVALTKDGHNIVGFSR